MSLLDMHGTRKGQNLALRNEGTQGMHDASERFVLTRKPFGRLPFASPNRKCNKVLLGFLVTELLSPEEEKGYCFWQLGVTHALSVITSILNNLAVFIWGLKSGYLDLLYFFEFLGGPIVPHRPACKFGLSHKKMPPD